MSRPWLCRQGFHRWGPNTRWPKSYPGQERWQRHCARKRCRAPLTFTAEPFIFGPIDRIRERRRRRAEMGTAA